MADKIVNEFEPRTVSHPGETLAEALEERCMSQAELAERTGRPRKTINEIIRGQAAIMPETAIQLERVLGIPAGFWNMRQRQHDEALARESSRARLGNRVEWLTCFPVSQMIRLGWIEKKPSRTEQLESLLSFLGLASPDEWEGVCGSTWREASFRRSKAFSTDKYALSAWLRKGELDAAAISCRPYDKAAFSKALGEIRKLARATPPDVMSQVTAKCAPAGVSVVFVPVIKGVHAWGAARWLSSMKALIILSLRGKLEDHFWFSFFHEAAHVLLSGKRDVFIDGLEEAESAAAEDKADVFARDLLIPPSAWGSFTASVSGYAEESVRRFAEAASVSPAVVVGRLMHEKLIPASSPLNRMRKRIGPVDAA